MDSKYFNGKTTGNRMEVYYSAKYPIQIRLLGVTETYVEMDVRMPPISSRHSQR